MTPSLKAIVERCERDLNEQMKACTTDSFKRGQKDEHQHLMPIILELLSIADERGKIMKEAEMPLEMYKIYGWNDRDNIFRRYQSTLDSTTKRLEQLAGLEREGKGE